MGEKSDKLLTGKRPARRKSLDEVMYVAQVEAQAKSTPTVLAKTVAELRIAEVFGNLKQRFPHLFS